MGTGNVAQRQSMYLSWGRFLIFVPRTIVKRIKRFFFVVLHIEPKEGPIPTRQTLSHWAITMVYMLLCDLGNIIIFAFIVSHYRFAWRERVVIRLYCIEVAQVDQIWVWGPLSLFIKFLRWATDSVFKIHQSCFAQSPGGIFVMDTTLSVFGLPLYWNAWGSRRNRQDKPGVGQPLLHGGFEGLWLLEGTGRGLSLWLWWRQT